MLEAGDDHGIWIPVVGQSFQCVVSGTESVLEDVPDDENDHGDTRPDHELGGFGGDTGVFVGVFRRDFAVVNGQLDCSEDMEPNHRKEAKASDPDDFSVSKLVQPFGVGIEFLRAREHQEITGEVACQKQNHSQSS